AQWGSMAVWGRGVDLEASQDARHIWAVRDLSLQIRTGEIVGVIGRNGAPKSTFLRILSRITEPTSGYADIHGAIGSLLEGGAGFHPELTGRDNIFLNRSIVGTPLAQLRRRCAAPSRGGRRRSTSRAAP